MRSWPKAIADYLRDSMAFHPFSLSDAACFSRPFLGIGPTIQEWTQYGRQVASRGLPAWNRCQFHVPSGAGAGSRLFLLRARCLPPAIRAINVLSGDLSSGPKPEASIDAAGLSGYPGSSCLRPYSRNRLSVRGEAHSGDCPSDKRLCCSIAATRRQNERLNKNPRRKRAAGGHDGQSVFLILISNLISPVGLKRRSFAASISAFILISSFDLASS